MGMDIMLISTKTGGRNNEKDTGTYRRYFGIFWFVFDCIINVFNQ
jgi:hypothetical protein